ncbi:MAG: hypothetical protein VKP62_00715 [Candidatus Sericytochromatia bacterium]|nr:hypothetical protein [Candidatus Sericytochromatia bacterium]
MIFRAFLQPQPRRLPRLCFVGGCVWCLLDAPVSAGAGVTLDRPIFDRETNVVLIPFRGEVPKADLQSFDGGTRLSVEFTGSQTTSQTPYKLGVFHPLVTKIELKPVRDQIRVRLDIGLTTPAQCTVVPDLRRGVLRVQLSPSVEPAPLQAVASLPTPPPVSLPGEFPAAPGRSEGGTYTANQERFQRNPVISASPPPVPLWGGPVSGMASGAYWGGPPPGPPPAVPYSWEPSVSPPVRYGGTAPLPGTPASGEYVYRKAVPSDNGRDVTEIQVRTPRRSDVDIQPDPPQAGVTVNVVGPEGVRPALSAPTAQDSREGWINPLPNEPWKMPVYKGDVIFRPVTAVEALLGFASVSERADRLGSNFDGSGSTLLGFAAHVPLSASWNVNASLENLAYTIQSQQLAEANTRRDEFYGGLSLEYLPIRRPWVLATGLGYTGRFVNQTQNSVLLPPPETSALFVPNLLFHGPTLGTRLWVPFWQALGVTGEVQFAPFMFQVGSDLPPAIGNVLGYQANLGLKWGARQWAANLGWRIQGQRAYNGVYGFARSGPEAWLIWRF